MITRSTKGDLKKPVVKSSHAPELVGGSMTLASSEEVSHIARNIFLGIRDLEDEIQRSRDLASEIGNRNSFNPKNWFSAGKDLTAVANTQNSINRRLFDLIQEIIRVNMLSHASLILLMDKMQKGMENGFTDSNGHITRLGVDGKNLAETATQLISGILDASKDTQERINENSKGISKIGHELEVKTKLDSSQSQAIALLEKQVGAKGELDARQSEAILDLEKKAKAKDELDFQQSKAIDNLERIAREKVELDYQQSEAIANLEKIAKAKDEIDSKQQAAIDEQRDGLEKLTVQITLLSKGLKDAREALQEHQEQTSGHIAKLANSFQIWRWISVVLLLAFMAWIAIIIFR